MQCYRTALGDVAADASASLGGGQTLFTLFPGKQPWVIVAILLRVSTPNRAMV